MILQCIDSDLYCDCNWWWTTNEHSSVFICILWSNTHKFAWVLRVTTLRTHLLYLPLQPVGPSIQLLLQKHSQLVRLVHPVYCYKETDKCDRSITAPPLFHTARWTLERESVWVPLKTTYIFELFPSYPPPQQPTCVSEEDCWVLLPHSQHAYMEADKCGVRGVMRVAHITWRNLRQLPRPSHTEPNGLGRE